MNKNALAFVILLLSVGIFGAYYYKMNSGGPTNNDNQNWQQWQDNDPRWDQWQNTPPPRQPNQPPRVEPQQPPRRNQPPLNLKAKSYEEAIKFSKEARKPVLLVFGAKWCHWCQKLKSDTLENQQVKAKIDRNYIYYYVDTDREKQIARKYGVSGIPHYVIIDSTERVLKNGSGYKDPNQFSSWMDGQNRNDNNRRNG